MEQENNKGQFNSNFGFLMAALGSAVGLGNLWSFPYKLGLGGGFAFLIIYTILAIVVGYPLMLSEIALGRKTQKAAIEAYKEADHRSLRIPLDSEYPASGSSTTVRRSI